jgi:phospholipid transport system transporter-binding protein
MQKQAELIFNADVFQVKGDINFANVMSLREQSLTHFNHRPVLSFDFAEVKSSDSSGLALVIEWVKLGKKNNKQIRLLHVPEDLMSIAKAAGLAELLQ